MASYDMHDFMSITKAMADENRIRILLALEKGELCVCQIVELLELAPSTVSKHMAILRQARLVSDRKKGRWVYYRLTNDDESLAGRAVAWALGALSEIPEVQSDRERLLQILRLEPEALCQIQRKRA